MRKYLIFLVVFIFVFEVLQIFSGMLLTMFYTPNVSWDEIQTLPSEVVFGNTNSVPFLIIALLALATAFGATKFFKKTVK